MPDCLYGKFSANDSRLDQWKAFLKRLLSKLNQCRPAGAQSGWLGTLAAQDGVYIQLNYKIFQVWHLQSIRISNLISPLTDKLLRKVQQIAIKAINDEPIITCFDCWSDYLTSKALYRNETPLQGFQSWMGWSIWPVFVN